jgi:hypothetical protein
MKNKIAKSLVSVRWRRKSEDERREYGRKLGERSAYFKRKYGWAYWKNPEKKVKADIEKVINNLEKGLGSVLLMGLALPESEEKSQIFGVLEKLKEKLGRFRDDTFFS